LAPLSSRAVATDKATEPRPGTRISHPDVETVGIDQMSTAPTIDIRGLAPSEGVAAGSIASETQRAWGGRTGHKKNVGRGLVVGAGVLVAGGALLYGLTRTQAGSPELEPIVTQASSAPAPPSAAPVPTVPVPAPATAPSAQPPPSASASIATAPRVGAPPGVVKSQPPRPKETRSQKPNPAPAPAPRASDDLGI
jgi:hypothetical protein